MEPLEGEPPAEPVAESKIDIVLTEPSKTASASSAATDASVSTPPAYVSRYLTVLPSFFSSFTELNEFYR